MDTATRERLVAEGRTRWFAIRIYLPGRRFPKVVHTWASDENDAASRIELEDGQVITDIAEQHR